MNEAHIESLQNALQQDKIDGWLFYGFRGSDPIAENILRLDHAKFTTRRWFYFVPAKGTPQKIVHAIEEGTLDNLPGNKRVYLPWQQLHQHLREALSGAKKVAMHYSPHADDNLPMRKGDFLLVDMWSKRRLPHAVYDDITWTFFIGESVPAEHQKIFDVVRNGRDAAIKAAQQRYPADKVLYGWQIDEEARQSITRAGYG